MNWDAIGAVGDLVSGIGVIVTLAYLATQVRQNSRQLDEATRIARSQLVSDGFALTVDGYRALTGGTLAAAWARAMANAAHLSDAELGVIYHYLVSEWMSSSRQLRVVEIGIAPDTDVQAVAAKWVFTFLGNDCALRWWAGMSGRGMGASMPTLRDAIDQLLRQQPASHRNFHSERIMTMRTGALPEAFSQSIPTQSTA